MLKLPSLQNLLEAGVHFGHQVRRGHPRMRPYIYGVREDVHIIDLTQSESLLKEAAEFVYELGKEGKILLFVGTKKQAQEAVKELSTLDSIFGEARELDLHYIPSRYPNGLPSGYPHQFYGEETAQRALKAAEKIFAAIQDYYKAQDEKDILEE